MTKFAAAAVALVLTSSAAFANHLEIKNSEVYQDSLATAYTQYNYGQGDQLLVANDISAKVKIDNSTIRQWNVTTLYQENRGAGNQTMVANRIRGVE